MVPVKNDTTTMAAEWAQLEQHFAHHAHLVNRFRRSEATDVVRMWQAQTNEFGDRLSPVEREALIERYCELFGTWPE